MSSPQMSSPQMSSPPAEQTPSMDDIRQRIAFMRNSLRSHNSKGGKGGVSSTEEAAIKTSTSTIFGGI
ncbi:hypothetical protein H4S01_000428 [Coemansia sp. RSA 2610]|nr:hypothetical protein H4S01_000428 [Coemansia sp. RSA 2610]